MRALRETLDSYEASHPDWFFESVVDLIGRGLRSLRHHVEDPDDSGVTWPFPVVELRFPVEWNWKAWDTGDETAVLQTLAVITEKTLRSKRRAVQSIAELAVQVRDVYVLNTLTKHVGLEKSGERYIPILSKDIATALSRLPRGGQQVALRDLYRPYSIGAAEIDLDLQQAETPAAPANLSKMLADETARLDVPPLTFHGRTDGQDFQVSLIAQFHPMVVDADERAAYFPIVIGLVFHPTKVELAGVRDGLPVFVPSSPDPTGWTKDERGSFWQALLEAWDEAVQPKTVNGVEAQRQVPVQVMLKATVVPFDSERRDAIVEDMVKTLRERGRLEHVECDLQPAGDMPATPLAELDQKIASGAFDVFLAHNSKNRAAVSRIGEHLRRRGVYPWLDKEQIPPGRRFQQHIQKAIRQVRTAAIFIGPKGMGPWQMLELEAFVQECVKRKVPVIPVLLPGASRIPKELPFLGSFTHVRFRRNVDERASLDQLQWGILGEKPRRKKK